MLSALDRKLREWPNKFPCGGKIRDMARVLGVLNGVELPSRS